MGDPVPADTRYVICVRNDGYPASLEPRKLYRVVPGGGPVDGGHVRVVDESGEDYLYPAEYFEEITLPQGVMQALQGAS